MCFPYMWNLHIRERHLVSLCLWSKHPVSCRAGSRVFGALCEIIVVPPPSSVYIIYWYIYLTLNRVKVHKYFFFRFKDYDEICGSATSDMWNYQLLRLWRQRRRADARQMHTNAHGLSMK
jgi:hypothetical protein